MTFPRKSCTAVTTGVRKGIFEDLKLYVSSGFSRQNVSFLAKDVADGGILHWNKEALQLAQRVPLPYAMIEKQLVMVSYFLENVDDLMIEPTYNVSQSSGWEVFMRSRRSPGACGALVRSPITHGGSAHNKEEVCSRWRSRTCHVILY
jgi:hypothetical protein